MRFVLTEVSAGLMFTSIAAASSKAKAVRNRVHARAAYDSALHFVDRLSLTQKESRQAREQARLDMANLVYVKPKKIFSAAVSKEDPFLHRRPKLKTRNSSQ